MTWSREEKLEMFGEGPWLDEPDRLEWRHLGFVCLVNRNVQGHLCGYVGVGPGHPWYGTTNRAIADAHGGLNYFARCAEDLHICHLPAPGEPDDVYWLGFDCAHIANGDYSPGLVRLLHDAGLKSDLLTRGARYRSVAYVRTEVERLAAQARSALRGLS